MNGKCKHGDDYCGKHWYCGECTAEMHRNAWRRMSIEEKKYDLMANSIRQEDDGRMAESCSCHLSAPCNYCVGIDDNE